MTAIEEEVKLPTWRVALVGQPFDLEPMTALFGEAEPRIFREGVAYYLEASNFERMVSVDEVREHARIILRRMSAAERIRCGGSFSVECGDVLRRQEDGSWRQLGLSGLLVTFDVRVPHAEAAPISARRVSSWIQLANQDPRIDEALRLFIAPGPTWFDLFKILEIVESDIQEHADKRGWLQEEERRLFMWIANSINAIGDAARHARFDWRPPGKPMTLAEAEALIRRVLTSWLDARATPDCSGRSY